ncbi:AzlC family ABC transporter permease [Acetomicrobium sp. S15 = DSM 107314]|uniref:AzlC family ABC transporter permease n=1 Tax=Acetomicrobium sp. S15 = DSM 107314 TaxID=2529858 RepID=UPI0018E0F246|nr:AzlC family ABC transporter permease [Acetomicrobium sp. S15 = DSM 107314]
MGIGLKVQGSLYAFLEGVRDETPLLFAVVPFGVIYGITALEAGLTKLQTQLMSCMIFGGSSQFAASKLFAEAAPWSVIVLTVAIINLRHLLYSASVAPYLQELSFGWKALLAYLLTDEAYAVTINHYQKQQEHSYGHLYFLGAGIALWISWQLSTAVGITLGKMLPPKWPLDFFLPLTFIAILVPTLKSHSSVIVALVAGVSSLLLYELPYKLGPIAAALIGIMSGFVLEARRRRP